MRDSVGGAGSWVAIQIWSESKLDWLRRYVPLERGIPSHDTFGRVFAALDPLEFRNLFCSLDARTLPGAGGGIRNSVCEAG
ncbi:transposase family protein [Burkholderia cenocepacia]|uniref:transposase family protein n=1 Tax=Burkholderia cenocepacia TaxID=95486 RepID=UPI002AB6EC8C|nr:transposase family protein [Burkholderia cenocepacia]